MAGVEAQMTGPILVSLHNTAFYQWLMAQARQAIIEDQYESWAQQWMEYDSNSNKTF